MEYLTHMYHENQPKLVYIYIDAVGPVGQYTSSSHGSVMGCEPLHGTAAEVKSWWKSWNNMSGLGAERQIHGNFWGYRVPPQENEGLLRDY